MDIREFEIRVNQWGQKHVPFLFVLDFELEKPFACKLEDAAKHKVFFEISHHPHAVTRTSHSPGELIKYPVDLSGFQKKFDVVSEHLHRGDSFLTNLTIKTEIKTNQSLAELFKLAKSKYKLLFRDDFLVFSPETFVRITGKKIFTFPMKGTIDSSIPEARDVILRDPKELAEHVTIVDLMRSDLSLVASNVRVTRFRYVEELKTNQKNLLQVSSEIEGDLLSEYWNLLGSILLKLLPAGSVSGAPKNRTVEIIREAEREHRGYYTGVFGYFDGEQLDSAVMIRYIENDGETLYYRSGGGITTQSDVVNEYREAIDKIYVPVT